MGAFRSDTNHQGDLSGSHDKRMVMGKHGCIVYGAMRDWEKMCMSLHVQTLVTFQCFNFFSVFGLFLNEDLRTSLRRTENSSWVSWPASEQVRRRPWWWSSFCCVSKVKKKPIHSWYFSELLIKAYSVGYNLVSVLFLDLVVGFIRSHMTGDQRSPGKGCSEMTRGCENRINEIHIENKRLWTACNIGRELGYMDLRRKNLEFRYC